MWDPKQTLRDGLLSAAAAYLTCTVVCGKVCKASVYDQRNRTMDMKRDVAVT